MYIVSFGGFITIQYLPSNDHDHLVLVGSFLTLVLPGEVIWRDMDHPVEYQIQRPK